MKIQSNSILKFLNNKVTNQWSTLLNWSSRDIVSRHTVCTQSMSYELQLSLTHSLSSQASVFARVMFSFFLFIIQNKMYWTPHRIMMHGKMKTRTPTQTAVKLLKLIQSVTLQAGVFVCWALPYWQNVFIW